MPSRMVFCLKNVDEAGFGVRESSNFGSIVNRKSPGKKTELSNLWGSGRHIFVATNEGRDLHAFEFVPRSNWTPESEGLLLQDQKSPIVSVQSSKTNPTIIYIVHKNSVTESWEFTQSSLKWIKRNEFQLSNTKGVEILSVVLHPLTCTFFWCERRSVSASNLVSCCICMREVIFPKRFGNDTKPSIGPLVAILHSCPAMSLYVIGRSACLVADFPVDLIRFILFWNVIERSLKVYVWNFGFVGDIDKTDFRAIVSELLCPWFAKITADKGLPVAFTSHPTTNELIVLGSNAKLSYFVLHDGNPVFKSLCKLHTDLKLQDDNVSIVFTWGLIFGLVRNSGVISLHDLQSGMELCVLEDLRGQRVHSWMSYHISPSVGFWSVNGIWKLQSKTVLEIATHVKSKPITGKEYSTTNCQNSKHLECFLARENEVLFNGVKPRTECTTMPSSSELALEFELTPCLGESVLAGTLCAINHLTKWNMKHWAAKLALDSVACFRVLANCAETDVEVPRDLLDLFVTEYVQSPVLALALLWDHPVHKDFVLHKLEQFVNGSTENPESGKTVLNELLQPFMREFLLLSKHFKSVIGPGLDQMTKVSSLLVNSVTQEVKGLLETFVMGSLTVESFERLSSLSDQHRQEVLECTTQYFKIDSQLEGTSSNMLLQKWKKVYRLEWKNGHWQRSKVALKEPYNTMLSILSRLFYDSKGDDLMGLVERGMDTIEAQETDELTEEYVGQSVLECLPVLNARNVNPKSVLVHSELFHFTGQETQALHLLLCHRMWQEAIGFVSCCGKASEKGNVLFVMLIKGLQRGKAPGQMLVEAVKLTPDRFSTQELLSMLWDQAASVKEPFVKEPGQTTVGEIRPFLQELIRSPSLH